MYETKVLLISLGELVKAKAENKKDKEAYAEIYEVISSMANAEGVILKPFEKED